MASWRKPKVKLVSASGQNPVKISNVAEGTEENDAVSFKQLKALQEKQVTLTASNAYANGGNDADGGKATQTLNNGLNFKFKSTDGELLNIKVENDTVTFTPKKVRYRLAKTVRLRFKMVRKQPTVWLKLPNWLKA